MITTFNMHLSEISTVVLNINFNVRIKDKIVDGIIVQFARTSRKRLVG